MWMRLAFHRRPVTGVERGFALPEDVEKWNTFFLLMEGNHWSSVTS